MKPKKFTKKTVKSQMMTPTSSVEESTMPSTGPKKNMTVTMIVILTLVILGIIAVNKGYVVTAIVDGRPIFRWQFVNALVSRFGTQTLETMISETLIDKEAQRMGVAVTQQEIDAKEEEILASFGGNVTLDEVLKYQGMTKGDFDSQVRLQIIVAKILSKDIIVTDEEVLAYIDQNRASMTASDEATLRLEATSILTDQKVSEKVQPWFTELKAKAKVLRFQ